MFFRPDRHSSRVSGLKRRAIAATLAGLSVSSVMVLAAGSPAQAAPTLGSASNPLKIALANTLGGLDPAAEGTVRTDLSLLSNLYSSLTTVGPNLKLTGDLATKWVQTSPTTWVFTLRKGVQFWNGDPLNASTVVWNLQRELNPKNALADRTYIQEITAYTAPSPTQLDVTTSLPDPNLPNSLSFFYQLDPTFVANNNPQTAAMGSGPYQLVSYNPEGNVVLKANSKYYGTPPAFKKVVYEVLPTDAARLAALESGAINVSLVLDVDDIPQLKKDKYLNVGAVPSTRVVYLKFNTLQAPLNYQDVRLALNYGVNKAAIAKAVFKGLVQPDNGQVLDSLYSGWDPKLKAYPYDPSKAKKLLTAAGYANGFTLEADVPAGTYVDGDLVVQAVAAQLAQIGVTLNIDDLPFTTWVAKNGTQHNMAPLSYYGQASQDDSTVGLLNFYNASTSTTAYWTDQTFDSDVNSLAQATNEEQIKAATRTALLEMYAQAPILFLFPQPQTYAYSKTISWKVRPDDWTRAYEMTSAVNAG